MLAVRFDCNEIAGTASEIAAYGTAVYLVPDSPEYQDAQAPPQQQYQAQQYPSPQYPQ